MADSGGWWGWVDTLKKQSEKIMDILEEDLGEFTKTITDDTTEVVKKQLEAPQGISTLFGLVETTTASSSSDKTRSSKSSSSMSKGRDSAKSMKTRFEARLLALQSDDATYLTEPSNDESYKQFSAQFDPQTRGEEIGRLVTSVDTLRVLYSKLVPNEVSYKQFWTRYFYKLELLKKEEERRTQILTRAEEKLEELDSWDWGDEEPDSVGEFVATKPSKTEEDTMTTSTADVSSLDEEQSVESESQDNKQEEPSEEERVASAKKADEEEQNRLAEEARAEALRKAAEEEKIAKEEERKEKERQEKEAEEKRKLLEETRKAEEKKKVAEEKQRALAEQQRLLEEQRVLEEKRRTEEQQRLLEAKQAEEQRKILEEKKAEEQKKIA